MWFLSCYACFLREQPAALPLTHSSDIVAGFCATVPPKPMSVSEFAAQLPVAQPSFRPLSSVGFASRFMATRNKTKCADVRQVGNPQDPDRLWQRATNNYWLKSGGVGRLLMHSKPKVKVGIWKHSKDVPFVDVCFLFPVLSVILWFFILIPTSKICFTTLHSWWDDRYLVLE